MQNKGLSILVGIILFGAGCTSSPPSATDTTSNAEQPTITTPAVVLPLDGNIAGYNPTYKRFGEYFKDRFTGYHTGEDSEVPPEDLSPGETQEVPVRAIADGTVRVTQRASGYGGVVVIAHDVGVERVNAIYGHLDLSSVAVKTGDPVKVGQFIANLGDGFTAETDGERQHLHFALYRGDDIRLAGYVSRARDLDDWINPQDFFREHGMNVSSGTQMTSYDALTDPQGKRVFGKLTFAIPDDWDVEYVPSIQALNLYRVTGAGAARERSMMIIRYFDASDFLTLSTVDVFSTETIRIGAENYEARRYVIQKKPGVPDFADQPAWRNERHTVTDFRDRAGRTRYYVVAVNPDLDLDIYARVLASMRIVSE